MTSIQVTATGESGGGLPPPFGTQSRGAIVTGTLTVTPGQTLYVMVDSGGGSGGVVGGGGASDVRSAPGSLLSRLIVAGGGGSAAQGSPPGLNPGGDAGAAGSDGQGSVTCGGEPGTQLGGGAGGVGISTGGAGTLGTGGSGGGGGGGGGLFGGGAGGTYSTIPGLTFGCGGGGGSSLVPPGGTESLAAAGTPPSVLFTFTAAAGSGAPTPPGGEAPGGGTPAGGSGPGGGAPPGASPGKPTLAALTLPGNFEAAASGPSVTASRGAKVSYRLSEPARLTFTVQRAALGRKRGPLCVARTPANAGVKRCTRWVKVPGSFTHAGVAGVNTFRFSGRIGGKTLRPGLHRLLGVAVDQTGDRSVAVQKRFRLAA